MSHIFPLPHFFLSYIWMVFYSMRAMLLHVETIRKYVGDTYFGRGKSYFRSGMVSGVVIEDDTIKGEVQGSGGNVYQTYIYFHGDRIEDSACGCPMMSDCKHVAALYLQAMVLPETSDALTPPASAAFSDASGTPASQASADGSATSTSLSSSAISLKGRQQTELSSGKTAEKSEKISDWTKTLRELLNDNHHSKNENRLEIAVMLEEAYDRDTGKTSLILKVRPKLFNAAMGKAAFTGIRWRDFQYPDHLRLPKSHVSFFRQLYLALSKYFYNDNWLPVWPDKAHDFWLIIQEHKKYGVHIVDGSKPAKAVEISGHIIEAGLVIKEEKNNLQLQHRFLLQGNEISADRTFLVGDPPVFAVIMGTGNHSNNFSSSAFSLHPVKIFNPAVFMAIQKKAVVIPKEEFKLFEKDFLPKLGQKFSLHSVSEKVVVPKVPPFALKIKVQKASAHSLGLECQFLYGDTTVELHNTDDTFCDKAGNFFLRDREKEHAALKEVFTLLKQLPLFFRQKVDFDQQLHYGGEQALGKETGGWFDGKVVLKGIDAVRFMDTLVPELQKKSDVKLELDDDLPDFVLDETPPHVEFTVQENEESTDWFDLHIIVSVQGEKVEFHQLFQALSAGEEFLFLENGKYFPLAHPAFDRLKQLIAEAKSIKDHHKDGLSLTRFQASLWDELKKLGIVTQQAEQWEKAMKGLLDFKNIHMPKVSSKLRTTLRSYQAEGFSWLKFLRDHQLGGVLADDMGLGKTVQTIALFCDVRFAQKISAAAKKPFLVIAPTSVVENWDSELKKFAPLLKTVILRKGDRSGHYRQIKKADVILISYALVHRDLHLLKPLEFDTIILDEAQFVKNRQAKIYADIRHLRGGAKIALTGTPMENNLMELWSIFSIVSPGLFPSPESFHEFYRKPIEKHNDQEALAKLRSRIKPFIMRRKKEVVASELPPKVEQTLLLEMNNEHRHIYDLHLQRERQRVLGMLKEGGLKEHRFEILAALTKMRQLCLHPGLVDEKYATAASTKLEALEEQVKTLIAEGHRVLIFSQFTGFLARVKTMFDAAAIKYLYLDGATRDRKSVIAQFRDKNGPPVFLISLKAGGFGLNLTEADYCILLDPWWNPAVESQAIDRIHRIGQKKHVFVYKMIISNSVEEKVLKLQEKKRQLFKNILEDGDVFASLVTEEDILKIFS